MGSISKVCKISLFCQTDAKRTKDTIFPKRLCSKGKIAIWGWLHRVLPIVLVGIDTNIYTRKSPGNINTYISQILKSKAILSINKKHSNAISLIWSGVFSVSPNVRIPFFKAHFKCQNAFGMLVLLPDHQMSESWCSRSSVRIQ